MQVVHVAPSAWLRQPITTGARLARSPGLTYMNAAPFGEINHLYACTANMSGAFADIELQSAQICVPSR